MSIKQLLSHDRAKYLSGPALYYLLLPFLLVLFFEVWRLICFWLIGDLTTNIPDGNLAESLLFGLRFDMVVACWIVTTFYVLSILPFIGADRCRVAREISFWLLSFATAATFFVHLVDIEFFRFFQVRLNGMVMLWTDTPEIGIGMAWETYPVIWYMLLWAFLVVAFVVAARVLQRWTLVDKTRSPYWVHLVWLLPMLVFLFYGGRGKLTNKAPLRWGDAYFSTWEIANQLALNPTYTFVHDATYNTTGRDRVEGLVDIVRLPGSENIVRELIGLPALLDTANAPRIHRPIHFDPQNDDPPNVVLIIMESFGSTKIGALDNQFEHDLSPCFDSIAEHGVLFDHIYSTGQHTYAGQFSSLFGYPHLFDKTVLKQARGYYHFHGLPAILRKQGYSTMFFMTHDPHFDNATGFLMANGMDEIWGQYDYDSKQVISTWGVSDHVMFDTVFSRLNRVGDQPFFATILTTSNHGPWEIPEVDFEHIPESEPRHKELNAFKYSDWALGRFLGQLQQDTAFENTLVVVTSDNGFAFHIRSELELGWHQIPLLMYNTSWGDERAIRVNRLGSQIDILATVMGQVRLDYEDYSFGRDLVDTVRAGTDYAHFSKWYGMGYVESDFQLILRTRSNSWSLYNLSDPGREITDSLPDLAKEYADKAKAIFQVGYLNCMRSL